jgi:hypothetical protein
MRWILRINVAALCGLLASFAVAADLPSADLPMEQVIDQFIDQRLAAEKVAPAAQADDANLLRRLMLDLGGRIPTLPETERYVTNTSPGKRVELVDQLLASPDFIWHQRNELDQMLLPNKPNDGDFRKYLLWAVQENRSWDAMFRDMLVGDEEDENRKYALTFIKSRAKDLDDMLNDTAILFFGVNVTCAKCHDHPLTPDWKQHHYYGMASFFSRTYLTKKNVLAERPFGEVTFKSKRKDDTKGEQLAKFEFLTGTVIDEPAVEYSAEDKKKIEEAIKASMQKDDAPPPPKPAFSPREKLVEVALRAEDNRFFARNIVNRVWNRFFGRGLVHPVDQLHSANAPSHPELLDWLTRDLVAHNYDLKRLIRGIVLSQAYSRSSEWRSGEQPPDPALFAVAKVKPLTPRQYGLSLLIARQSPDSWPPLDKPNEWAARREQLENAANGYAAMFEMPGENFQIAVDEALLFANSQRIEEELLRDAKSEIVGYLKSLPNQGAVIETAFRSICSRSPTDDERAAIQDYLQKHAADRTAAIRQFVWALLTGPEMRFSY